jgi:ferredoxin
MNSYQASIGWVLKQAGVSVAIPSMTTIEQVKQDCAVMGKTWTWRDGVSLGIYATVTNGRYCRACGSCAGTCPRGADVPRALRALMYAEGYRRPDLAGETLAGSPPPCDGCPGCTVECRFGLPVGERMVAAAGLGPPIA